MKNRTKQKKLVFTDNPLSLFLPAGTLDYFDIESYEVLPSPELFGETYVINLVEKNIKPTVPQEYDSTRLRFKGYSLKSLSDFPVRGRKFYLSICRRKWQIDWVPGTIMREITIEQEGVRLTKDFAFFLKEKIDSTAVNIETVAQEYRLEGNALYKAYKHKLSDFEDFKRKHSKAIAEESFVFPGNMGVSLGIDETGLFGGICIRSY